MKVRYAINALRRNWSNRHWYTTVFNSYVAGRLYQRLSGNDGEYVVEKDWDNLLILDGCRYDLFEDVFNEKFKDEIGGNLSMARSRGSGSPEFLRENFKGRDLADTVYVTANPFVYSVLDNPFHHVDHVWMNDWDEELETVRPHTMVEHAIKAHEKYPNKRLIVHFMQPHHPFIGDFRLDEDRGYVGAMAKSLDEDVPDVRFIWERFRKGEVSEEDVRKAYRANLILALEEASTLVEEISGKHVITSDHGNAFGERVKPFPTTTYGHGDHLRIPALVDVPWLEFDSSDRRTVIGDEAKGHNERDYEEESINDRLEALGYK